MSRRDAPATHRNREPLLEVLRPRLPDPGLILEVASGTGQHAAFLARELPHVTWQPTEREPALLASIEAWSEEASPPNLRAPLVLDARADIWPVAHFDALFNANMIHIAPWEVAEGLFAGVGRGLAPGGKVFLYGPFRIGGAHTAPSNAAFAEDLRGRDPTWGVRDLEDVEALALAAGLSLRERIEMPANNQVLVFERD